jgi:hypothetical protein
MNAAAKSRYRLLATERDASDDPRTQAPGRWFDPSATLETGKQSRANRRLKRGWKRGGK